MNYKLFAEGVIFLMKRKTNTGVKLLSQVIDRMRMITDVSDENKNTANRESQASMISETN